MHRPNIHLPLIQVLANIPERCLVGVSGGIDSVVLLHALVRAGKKPVVVHFDHGWRRDSGQDAAFVQSLAKQFKLKYIGGRAPGKLKTTEQSARVARWNFFSQAARRARCQDLILAHNADDQVETFLHQLLRGGGSGARGIRPLSTRGSLRVQRPWLGIWRREIAAYAKAAKLVWREDSTNTDTRLTRNRIRHRLLPYLQKQFSQEVPQALWRAAEILGAEAEWLEALSSPLATPRQLKVAHLRPLPVAQQRRILRAWLQEHGVADLAFADVESARSLLINRFPAKINLAANRFLRRRSGLLFLE